MKRSSVLLVAIAAALAPLPGRASEISEPLSLEPLAPSILSTVTVTTGQDFAFASGKEAPIQFASGNRTRLESIRYRRRYREPEEKSSRGNSSQRGFVQLHGGYFDPDGELSSGALFGFKVGTSFEDHIQLGIGLDWNHRSDHQSTVVQEVPLPGGGTAERRLDLASSSSDLVPIMASLQIAPGGRLPLVPYFGIGGGYEVLFVTAEDFTTGTQWDATYDGWGWQAWGGVALPLGSKNKLSGEVFMNNAQVGRDIEDPSGRFREIVSMDGIGLRIAVTWTL